MAKRKKKIPTPEHEALSREAEERMKRVLDRIRAQEAAQAAAGASARDERS